MKYHLVQLGCQMNLTDGERIGAVLQAMGYEYTDSEGDAELLGVVACSVRQKAIDRVYSKISRWNKWKSQKNLLTFVSGCILPSDREKFLARFDLLFSINELPQLPFMISQYGVPTPSAMNPGSTEGASKLAHSLAAFPSLAVEGASGNGGMPVALRTTTLQQLGLEPETIGPSRPVGPLWLRDSDGPVLNPAEVDEAKIPDRRKEELRERRRSALRTITLMKDELTKHGGASKAALTVLSPGSGERRDPMGGFWNIEPSYRSHYEAFIPIQNGCDKFCSFCAVPYTRGREVSRPSEDILAEVERLVARGYATITLLGQNVNSYGLDRKGAELSFAGLLEKVAEIIEASGRRVWVYFTSPHPKDMGIDVLETMASHASLAKQVHLPIQSGDDKLLFRMNRNYGMERYKTVVDHIRQILPAHTTLFTDIIVGFSGETREQFANTKAAMLDFGYQMAFIAAYSPRPGAASSRWEDDIELEEKKLRLQELTDVLHQTSLAYNKTMIGVTMPLLVDMADPKGKFVQTRNEGRIQVRVPLPEGVDAQKLVGTFVDARIESVRPLSMEARLVSDPRPSATRS